MVRRYRRGGVEPEKKVDPDTGKPIKPYKDNLYRQDDIDKGTYDDYHLEPPADGDSSSDEESKKEMGGRRRRTLRIPKGVHVKAKTLKRMLKSKGLKTTGKKATLRSRARKAHLIRGGGK